MYTNCEISEWRIKDLFIAAILFNVVAVVFILLSQSIPQIKENIPQNLISSVILSLSLLCGAVFILRKYPIEKKTIGFEKENISKALFFGILGGLFVSIPEVNHINKVSHEAV